jgi:hypothetical protein
MLVDNQVIEIVSAEHIGAYKIKFQFNDGRERIVDFEPFLMNAANPMITEYRDIEKFKAFHLEHGDVMWGDFELCFPIADLYERHI